VFYFNMLTHKNRYPQCGSFLNYNIGGRRFDCTGNGCNYVFYVSEAFDIEKELSERLTLNELLGDEK